MSSPDPENQAWRKSVSNGKKLAGLRRWATTDINNNSKAGHAATGRYGFKMKRLHRKRQADTLSSLSYANPADPILKQRLIRTIERFSGRDKFVPIYNHWKQTVVGKSKHEMTELLDMLNVDIVKLSNGWPADVPDGPLVIIANHPFGLGDGLAMLSLAEEIGRPFRVLINAELLKVPEIGPYALPVDFRETKEALKTNLKTKKEALRCLREGMTIVVFPAGGVATANKPFGKAEDLPWKVFPARLIQDSRANVLPVYFYGQNGPLFHLASRFSMTLRLSLYLAEFRKFTKSQVFVRIGDLISYEQLASITDRQILTRVLYDAVHGMDTMSLPPSSSRLLHGRQRAY